MTLAKPTTDDLPTSDTVKMRRFVRHDTPEPSAVVEEEPTVIQPVLRPPMPSAAEGDG